MSTLLECVELVEETRDNSKQALIEKGVELADSYKLSDVDEKIAEIQVGGGSSNIIDIELPECVDGFEWLRDNYCIVVAIFVLVNEVHYDNIDTNIQSYEESIIETGPSQLAGSEDIAVYFGIFKTSTSELKVTCNYHYESKDSKTLNFDISKPKILAIKMHI